MRDFAIRIDHNEVVKSEENLKLASQSDFKEKLKSRLGFVYFLILMSTLIILFTR